MEEKEPKIKNLILRSGIPLEISTIQELKKFGIEDNGEIEYNRDGKIFSTDIAGIKGFSVFDDFHLSVNFSIECKYKERNHKWVFMEYPESEIGTREFSSNEFFGDFFIKLLERRRSQINNKYWDYPFRESNFFNFPKVHKGVDISNSEFDRRVISEAVTQAVFGATVVHHRWVEISCEFLAGDDINNADMVLSLPIVVTTADIFKIKQNVTLEEIEKSDLSELIENTDGVLYYYTDYTILRPFVRSLLEETPLNLSDKQRQFVVSDSKKNALSTIHPGYVYIINYYKLREGLTTCIHNIETLLGDLNKIITTS